MLDVLANTATMKDPDISSLEKSTLLGSATKVDSQYVNIAYYDKNGDSMTDSGTETCARTFSSASRAIRSSST